MNYEYYIIIESYFYETKIYKISDFKAAIEKYKNCCYRTKFVVLKGVKDGKEKIIKTAW